MKIAVIGYSGSGKSTLTKNLAKGLRIPHLYLDTVNFLPGWVERDREESRRMVRDFLERNDSWVIDGNYSKFYYEQRLEQADYIIFLNFPRLRCFWRAWRRSVKYQGKVRESAAEGCPEKFDWEFIRWILWDARTKKRKSRLKICLAPHRDKLERLERTMDKIRDKYGGTAITFASAVRGEQGGTQRQDDVPPVD